MAGNAQRDGGGGYLCNVSKLLAGEVDEGQVVESGGDRRVVLDERAAAWILWEELMNPGVVAQQPAVGSEGQAAEIAPTRREVRHTVRTIRKHDKTSLTSD